MSTDPIGPPSGVAEDTRPKKSVFVIMPFEQAPTRNREQLNTFFEFHLKRHIESATSLKHRHFVARSDDTFEITPHIIRSLYSADVVIADLSGERGNPNVMYELGVRLGVSHKPVILIREDHKDNKQIFDAKDYYIHPYDPLRYPDLQTHILKTLKAYEDSSMTFYSPVLRTLELESSVVERLELRRLSRLLLILNISLQGIHELLLYTIVDFCKVRGVTLDVVDLPETHDDEVLHRLLTANKDLLESVEWSAFEFLAYTPPAMQAYLSGNSPEQLLPHPEGVRLNTFVLRVWSHFFATSAFWRPMSLTKLRLFAHETLWLMRSLMAASLWLDDAGPKDRKHSQEMLAQALTRSKFMAVHEGRATLGFQQPTKGLEKPLVSDSQ